MANKTTFTIVALSDATGDLAHNLAVAASRQFEAVSVKIVRRGMVKTEKKIREVVADAKSRHAVILFTMVSQELRRMVLSEAQKEGVVAMDIMGPALDLLASYFHTLPSPEPGLQYKTTKDYYKRTEAVEFAVRHDDGSNLATLDQADIVLLGISRSSKTPISIYLAYHGYRCANIPIVKGTPLSEKVLQLDRKKLIGLVVSPEALADVRSTRLQKMGRPESEDYAQQGHIEQELQYAKEIFAQLEGIPVVDVTGKAIEEVAIEILHALSL